MSQVFERVLEDVARQVSNPKVLGHEHGRREVVHQLGVLDCLISDYDNVNRFDFEDLHSTSSASAEDPVDISGFLSQLESADQARLAAIEQEMMAKLVNRMSSKESLLLAQHDAESVERGLSSESKKISDELELRKLACRILSGLIGDMQQSLSHDPYFPPSGIDR